MQNISVATTTKEYSVRAKHRRQGIVRVSVDLTKRSWCREWVQLSLQKSSDWSGPKATLKCDCGPPFLDPHLQILYHSLLTSWCHIPLHLGTKTSHISPSKSSTTHTVPLFDLLSLSLLHGPRMKKTTFPGLRSKLTYIDCSFQPFCVLAVPFFLLDGFVITAIELSKLQLVPL